MRDRDDVPRCSHVIKTYFGAGFSALDTEFAIAATVQDCSPGLLER